MQMGRSMTEDAEQPHANPDSCRPEAHVAERLEKSNLRAACGGGFFDRMAQHGCGSFDLDSIACLRSCARAVAARAKDSTTSIAFQLAWWNRRSGRPMVDNMTPERSVGRLDPCKLERAR